MSQQVFNRATPIKRILAFIYDLFLIIPLMMIVVALWLPFNNGIAIEQSNPLYPYMMFTAAFITPIFFYTYFWHKAGQTLGMKSWKLRVITINGHNLSIRHSFIKAILFIILLGILTLSILSIFAYQFTGTNAILLLISISILLGFTAAFTAGRQTIIDKLTDTCIIQLPEL